MNVGANAPKVSIALPVYNGERFLDRAITTVIAQDWANIELILADNGSTDSTREICERWAQADSRVRYLRSDVNLGAALNFNRAFEASTGTYFKWIAADDEIAPSFVSSCVAVLERSPGVSLVYPRVVDIDDDGVTLTDWGPLGRAGQARPGDRAGDVILNETRAFPIFGVTRREQMARTRLIKPWTGSDYLVLLDLALLGRFVEVPEPLFLHREHLGRSTRQFPNFRDRAAWFDTRKSARFSLPRWSNLLGMLVAPFRIWSGARTVVDVGVATIRLYGPQWKALVKEVIWALGDTVDLLRSRST